MFQSIASQFQQLPRSWGWSGHQGWDHSCCCHSFAHCSALHMVSISTIGMENALRYYVNVTCNFSKAKSENAYLISKVNHNLILTHLRQLICRYLKYLNWKPSYHQFMSPNCLSMTLLHTNYENFLGIFRFGCYSLQVTVAWKSKQPYIRAFQRGDKWLFKCIGL